MDKLKTKGFTLVELMIVLAITGLLVVLATPGFTETIQNNLLSTQMNTLHTALNLGRSEAIKRSNNITICASDNGTKCREKEGSIDHQHHYHHGWIVFVDNATDGTFGTFDAGDGDQILRVQNKIEQKNSKFHFSPADEKTVITFASSGLAVSGSGETFTLCDIRGTDHAKGLIIGPTGRPQPTETVDADGTALVCAP